MQTIFTVEGIVNSIQKRIHEYEEISEELLRDMKSDLPFPSEIKQRYENIGNLAEGLQEAIDIIRQGGYMEEDIDLSGGSDG